MKTLSKKLMAVAIAGTLGMASVSAFAEGPSANVSIVSNYIWRGATQTSGNPAVQGGLDWEKDKLSFGTWGSAVDNGSEIDFYGAYNFGPVTVGAIYYYYPGQTANDVYEVNVGGDAGPVSLMASYDPKASASYIEAGYSMELSKGTTLDFHVGSNSANSATDYSVGFATAMGGMDLGVTAASHSVSGSAVAISVGKSI